MPLSDHYARTERLAVQIVTCDPATQRVEGVGKDAAVIQISTAGRPAAFRWPKEGEYWVIERENADWTLLTRIEEDGLVIKAKDGQPGDLMGPDGWIPQGDVPVRYNDSLNNFEIRDGGVWVPYAAPGVSPEIFIGTGTPPGVQTMWVDTDDPGVDLSNYTDRLAALEDPPLFHAYNNDAAFTLTANGAYQKNKLSAVAFDSHGWFDTTNWRYTPQRAGIYRISAQSYLLDNMNSGEQGGAAIYKNGGIYRHLTRGWTGGIGIMSHGGSALCVANGTTDYFELYSFWASSGGPARRLASTEINTFMSGNYVGTG